MGAATMSFLSGRLLKPTELIVPTHTLPWSETTVTLPPPDVKPDDDSFINDKKANDALVDDVSATTRDYEAVAVSVLGLGSTANVKLVSFGLVISVILVLIRMLYRIVVVRPSTAHLSLSMGSN